MKPDPYLRAIGALQTHGKEAAEEVASFEARQVKEIKDLVEKENIDCDFVVTRASDVCLYDEANRDLKTGLEKLTKAGVSTAEGVFYSDHRTAEGVSDSIKLQNSTVLITSSGFRRQRRKGVLLLCNRPRLAL